APHHAPASGAALDDRSGRARPGRGVECRPAARFLRSPGRPTARLRARLESRSGAHRPRRRAPARRRGLRRVRGRQSRGQGREGGAKIRVLRGRCFMTAKANAPAPEDAGAITFEQMMGRLQDLVAKLEEGQLSLDESIRSFEEGMALVKKCTEVLDRAEERIQKLTRDSSGRPMTSPLDGDEDEAGTGGDELPF